MAWFKKEKSPIQPIHDRTVHTKGLWQKCEQCKETLWKKDLQPAFHVCPQCNFHFRMSARERLERFFDKGRYKEYDRDLVSDDPLDFVDKKPYRQRLVEMQAASGMKDALLAGEGKVAGNTVCVCAMEPTFISGSMGVVVGEKITRAIERCLDQKHPLIIFSCSGGARMQEGALSLMQMAKITSALAQMDQNRLPYISVITNPTTGGVTASYAMLGDLNIAEPGALIGFAGPRVIEQTIRQKLPPGFQRSEFLLQHGMLDAIVQRQNLKSYCVKALEFFGF